MNLPNTGSPQLQSIFHIGMATPLAHRSRKASPAPPSDQTTRHPKLVSAAPGREGWRSKAARLSPLHRGSGYSSGFPPFPPLSPHLCLRSLPVDRSRELLLASSRWVGSEGRGEATGASTTVSGFLAIQFGIHKSVSCTLKTTRQSHKWYFTPTTRTLR